LGTSLSSGITAAILDDFHKIGPPVAVRSSGALEDLPGFSFAGQYSTYLNVRGEKDVIKAIQKCYASLFSERALSYSLSLGIKFEMMKMSVLIQQMIDANVSGVLFTVNPVDLMRGELVVEAFYGLGEDIVSGKVTPERYIIDRNTLTIKEVHYAPNRGADLRTLGFNRDTSGQILSNMHLKSLATLGMHLEDRFGHPQDVEWALKDSALYIIQTRPVTTS